jgi:hypothetical protein
MTQAQSEFETLPVDHEARHSLEEFPKDLLGLYRQCGFPESTIHQPYPSVADSLIDSEWRMPRAEPGMASLLDVGLRPSKPTDQEIPEALLGTLKILRRVHGSQKIVLGDLSIEGSHQARETLLPNHGINFGLLHVLGSPYRTVRTPGLGHLSRFADFSLINHRG